VRIAAEALVKKGSLMQITAIVVNVRKPEGALSDMNDHV